MLGTTILHTRGEKLVFKRDTGSLKNMPYINVGDIVEAFAHANIEAAQDIEIVRAREIDEYVECADS